MFIKLRFLIAHNVCQYILNTFVITMGLGRSDTADLPKMAFSLPLTKGPTQIKNEETENVLVGCYYTLYMCATRQRSH